MAKEREKTVDVTLDNGEAIKIRVTKPSIRVNSQAQRIGATVWTQCIQDGVMTKQELEQLMREKGIWGDEEQKKQDKIQEDIF